MKLIKILSILTVMYMILSCVTKEQNKVYEVTSSSTYDSNGELISQENYKYNDKGLLAYYSIKNDLYFNETIKTYDNNNLVLTMQLFKNSNDSDVYEFEYNDNTVTTIINDNVGILGYLKEEKYSNGKIKESIVQNKGIELSKTKYVFDDNFGVKIETTNSETIYLNYIINDNQLIEITYANSSFEPYYIVQFNYRNDLLKEKIEISANGTIKTQYTSELINSVNNFNYSQLNERSYIDSLQKYF